MSSDSQTPTIPFFPKLIATGLYSGYAPIASGTVGSLLALLLFYLFNIENHFYELLLVGCTFFVGVYVSNIVAKSVRNDDPSIVVIDEFVGMWLTLVFLPTSIAAYVCAFLFFRLFDIFKPFPARSMESLQGGWGIMLDDVAAGIYANLLVRAVFYFF
ncbi:MAG: phosphatidylglycerophosphatase A [Ignavibacteriales bacterium]|nr:phosphatidylglycerophosphatase A [Ignavibacteriales bacterium]